MAKPVTVIILFTLSAIPGFADIPFFQGTFSADDQVALFNFTANVSESITIQTYSYAGGSVNGVTIPAGGFAPAVFLFDNVGDVFPLTNITPCAGVGKDPVTGNCDDIFFQDTFGPGTFTLALAVDDNRPVDTSVSDGFIQDGNPGFTCQEAGTSGSFCDVTALGTSRTGDYAISIAGADSVAQLPEPGSVFLLLAGCALTALLGRRHSSNLR